jgi:hypothetical protein
MATSSGVGELCSQRSKEFNSLVMANRFPILELSHSTRPALFQQAAFSASRLRLPVQTGESLGRRKTGLETQVRRTAE